MRLLCVQTPGKQTFVQTTTFDCLCCQEHDSMLDLLDINQMPSLLDMMLVYYEANTFVYSNILLILPPFDQKYFVQSLVC